MDNESTNEVEAPVVATTPRPKYIKSVSFTDTETLTDILALHIKSDCFDLDPTYGQGVMHKGLKQPRLCFDLNPSRDTPHKSSAGQRNPRSSTVAAVDCTQLPLADASINSIIFDPPFLFGNHGTFKKSGYTASKYYTHFQSFEELEEMYKKAMQEFWRVLKPNGFLVFKCQDLTDSKTTMTHCLVWQWAQEIGYYPKDLFIKVTNRGRKHNPAQKQKHARKYHSYYWIFQKKKQKKAEVVNE